VTILNPFSSTAIVIFGKRYKIIKVLRQILKVRKKLYWDSYLRNDISIANLFLRYFCIYLN